MSLYWQQALSNSGNESSEGRSEQQQPSSHWDHITLGGAPAPQYQWNPNQNQQLYQQQHPQTQQNVGFQAVLPQQQQAYPNASVTSGHSPEAQHAQAVYDPYQQVSQHQQQQPSITTKTVQQAVVRPEPPKVQHTPILRQNPPPEAHRPQMQPQQQHQSHQESRGFFPVEPIAQFAYAPYSQQQAFKAPESSEDDWDTALCQPGGPGQGGQTNQNLNLREDKVAHQGSRESSLGGSWSQNGSERNSVDDRAPENAQVYWMQEYPNQNFVPTAQQPESVLENGRDTSPEKQQQQINVVINSFETLTSEMENMSDVTPTPAKIAAAQDDLSNDMVMVENVNEGFAPLETNASMSFDLSNVGEAQATSTPKAIEDRPPVKQYSPEKQEKRNSISRERKGSNNSQRSKKTEEEKSDHSNSTSPSVQPIQRGSIRASYRNYKQQYKEIVNRLNGYRIDRSDYRSTSKLSNPLVAAASAGFVQRPTQSRQEMGRKLSSSSYMEDLGRASAPLGPHFDDGSINRRHRISRLEEQRPNSRSQFSAYSVVPNMSYASSIGSGRYPQFPMRQGRHSTIGAPYNTEMYEPRRPHSTFGAVPPDYAGPNDGSSSLSASDEDEEHGESEDELRRFNFQDHPFAMQPPYGDAMAYDEGESYFFGVVRLELDVVKRVMRALPPPAAYYQLKPIEKAAFIFYATVYKHQYENVDAFHKRFNREYYKYVCAGDSSDVALYKICKSMQDQFNANQRAKSKMAYDAAQKHLFSDDHESIDGQSDIASVDEKDEDNSVASVEAVNNGYHMFTCPHLFMKLGVGGRMVTVSPALSVSVVALEDLRSIFRDISSIRIVDAVQHFKGPLIPTLTPTHTVRLYIQRQIESIRSTDVARQNILDNDVVDSLLIWQLLEMMVQQHGKVTGPDVARLLTNAISSSLSVLPETPVQESLENTKRALERFTAFLLGGHIDEAIESAVRDGLYADAMLLVRRLFVGDQRKIAEIEERFLSTRSSDNPVTTLVSVASDQPPPILTNPPLDDHMSWRTHAAIVLANLNTPTAWNTVYHLGRALAKRDYHCAADFCMLAVCVLAGYDPFQPVEGVEGEEDVRRHISLIHSGIPDDYEQIICPYGFAIPDLHATEIFDYALRLATGRESPLTGSVEYQTARIKYSKLLSGYGGFATDAFRYGVDIAKAAWNNVDRFDRADLLELCDLAERLQYIGSADQAEMAWVDSLREKASQMAHRAGSGRPVFAASTMAIENPKESVNAQKMLQETSAKRNSIPEQHFIDPEALADQSQAWQDTYQESDDDANVADIGNQQEPEYERLDSQIPAYTISYEQKEPNIPWNDYRRDSVGVGVCAPAADDVNPEQYSAQNAWGAAPEQNLQPIQQPQFNAPEPQNTPVQPVQPNTLHTAPMESFQSHSGEMQQAVDSSKQNSNDLRNSPSKGWLGSLKEKVTTKVTQVTAVNPMNLPVDKNPQITWDPVQKKYIGQGTEEEFVAPPPPSIQTHPVPSDMPMPSPSASGSFRMARVGGASRYIQPAEKHSGNAQASEAPAQNVPAPPGYNFNSAGTASAPTPVAPVQPAYFPTGFSFIPAAADDSEYVDPFSGEANPSIPMTKADD